MMVSFTLILALVFSMNGSHALVVKHHPHPRQQSNHNDHDNSNTLRTPAAKEPPRNVLNRETRTSLSKDQSRRDFFSSGRILMPSFAGIACSSIAPALCLNIQPSYASEMTNDNGSYIETDRGLLYKVTKPPTDASSAKPERAQKVKTKYTLYLNGFPVDGNSDSSDTMSSSKSTKVDSSNGLFGEKPFEFLAGVSQVIKGWDLIIMDMKVGEGRRIVVPSDLGYGDKGAGGKIPGGANLYFDLELVSIGDKAKLGEEQLKWLDEHPL